MLAIQRIKIRNYEIGLRFREDEFQGLAAPGVHWTFDPFGKVGIEVVSQREPWLMHNKLDVIVKSGALRDRAVVLDLKDYERALVWIDGRFSHVLPPGLYAYWSEQREVKTEIVDARHVRFEHRDLAVISRSQSADRVLEMITVEAHCQGVLLIDGQFVETLSPGRYAFWKNMAQVKLFPVDLREAALDISGQDIMTADKVTLRVNALVNYRVVDPRLSVTVAENAPQALYREAQLALRAVIGARELDAFLAGKDGVAEELVELVRPRAKAFGLELISVGIRDVILPGEMKDLMNKVTEAKKAAEANLIARREETAAMRSQANTARLLAESPTLMRLKELEVLEKVAASGKLNIMLGEKGLADKVVNLL
ncbi:MAG: slipin family protein [Planctomycetia bacterium]|nr:slipin family protein [Planctomycetia bacterium]